MKKRVISAIIVVAVFIPLFLIGGIPFGTAVGLVAALGFKEIIDLKENRSYPITVKIIGMICLLLLIVVGRSYQHIYTGLSYGLIGLTVLLLLIPAIFDKKEKYTTKDALYLIGAILLIALFFKQMILIEEKNKWILLYLILVATITDTFAMLVGSLIGKHKLIPDVSPKKSVEGSIGGSLVGTIVCTIYHYNVIGVLVNLPVTIIVTLVLSILGQLGDLFFSKMKRESGIKDFSNIMPGHGGVLDRLDSMIFVIIAYTIIVNLLHLF